MEEQGMIGSVWLDDEVGVRRDMDKDDFSIRIGIRILGVFCWIDVLGETGHEANGSFNTPSTMETLERDEEDGWMDVSLLPNFWMSKVGLAR